MVMDLIILDYLTFTYKDHAVIGDEFEVVHDIVITQKSYFKINKNELNAKVGDYVYVKNDNAYFGIVENIEDEKTHLIISTVDFKEVFKIEVLVKNYNGNVATYLEEVIRKTYLQNSDLKQNLYYLSINVETSRTGSFIFDEDKVMTIYELLELANKMYGVYIRHEVVFNNGNFSGVMIRIVNVISGVKIKADKLILEDLVINDSSKESVNKAIYHPKSSNLFFKDTVIYYLQTDGSITKDNNSSLRYQKVKCKVETYSDNDYLDLDTKALSILSVDKTDHQISFTINKKNHSLEVLRNLEIGDFVEFIYKGKRYDSLVTGIKYFNTFEVASITLGEFRLKLTEKIQILSKNVKSNIGNVTVNNTGYSDLDGGEF